MIDEAPSSSMASSGTTERPAHTPTHAIDSPFAHSPLAGPLNVSSQMADPRDQVVSEHDGVTEQDGTERDVAERDAVGHVAAIHDGIEHDLEQLYSPAMLAELLAVSVRQVRNWQRAGLLHPAAVVMQVPYFGFAELATARLLAQWKAKGVSVQSIQRQLEMLRSHLGVNVDLIDLPVVAVGKRLLLRQGETVVEASGQLHFSFEASLGGDETDLPATLNFEEAAARKKPNAVPASEIASLEQMVEQALIAEDADDYDAAIEWYRSALAAHGPNPDICFQLAELLYRQGDLNAARERYFMALEIDPELVEAQANLGCVLAECGQTDLAIAAFEGALRHYEEFADVHFHLARALDETGQATRAAEHWRRFLELSPASPWADEARQRLNASDITWLTFDS